MKKTLYSILIVCVFLFLFVVYLLLSQSKKTLILPPSQVPTPTPVPVTAKNVGKITISGVEVNNFTDNPENTAGQPILSNTSSFTILFIPSQQLFSLVIQSAPFEPARQAAEQAFLKELGISEKDACKLFVRISTPSSINPELTGQVFGLSFCK